MDRVIAETAIRELVSATARAWNAGDIDTLVGYYLPDAFRIGRQGRGVEGRAAIERYLREESSAVPRPRVAHKTVWIAHAGDNVASIHMEGAAAYPDSNREGFYWIGTGTVVLTEGEWKIASLHYSAMRREARSWFELAWDRLSRGLDVTSSSV